MSLTRRTFLQTLVAVPLAAKASLTRVVAVTAAAARKPFRRVALHAEPLVKGYGLPPLPHDLLMRQTELTRLMNEKKDL